MADAALTALRAAACECPATAGRFSPAQSAEAIALANALRVLFSSPTTAATSADVRFEHRAPLLPQLPTELTIEVLQHLDVRSLGRLACTCRQLYFGPPCPPRPMSLIEAAIRRRADEAGRWTPSSLPAGVSKSVPFLLQRQWRAEMAVRTVAAGLNRSFFVDANGALLACGADDKPGLLGLRGGSSQTPFTAVVPTPVPSMAGVRMRAVACRDYCNLAVSEAGQVFAWGDLEDWEEINHCAESAPEPAPILALQDHRVCQVVVAAGRCAALTEDGALFTWETARDIEMALDVPIPELGYGRFVHDVGAPYRVFAFDRVRITSVAAGTSFTVAVTEAGAVYSFGENDGRLGHGEEDARHVFLPKRIEALDCIHVVTVAAGAQHTLALTRCGSAYSWGASDLSAFELGHGNDDSEVSVSTGSCIQAIAAVSDISCAVTEAGALYTWGYNSHGNLGHGDALDRDRPTLVAALQDIRVVGVSVDTKHTLALAADGSVYSFGKGLGLGISREVEGAQGAEPMLISQRIPNFTCMVPL